MTVEKSEIRWGRMLAMNGWQWDSAKSYEEEYGYYYAEICGKDYYNIGCWARVSDGSRGINACGDYGVAWIECDISTYTSCEYLSAADALEVLAAIDHAESNLLRCGIPFVKDHRFHGEEAEDKAQQNASIRGKLGLDAIIEKEADNDEP